MNNEVKQTLFDKICGEIMVGSLTIMSIGFAILGVSMVKAVIDERKIDKEIEEKKKSATYITVAENE